MTEKQQEKYKEIVYNPYTEAWAVMKELKTSDLSNDDVWKEYHDKCETFRHKYEHTEIGCSIYRVMLDAGDEAMRIYREERKV